MNKAQVNPDLDEVKLWKKVLLNLSRLAQGECRSFRAKKTEVNALSGAVYILKCRIFT